MGCLGTSNNILYFLQISQHSCYSCFHRRSQSLFPHIGYFLLYLKPIGHIKRKGQTLQSIIVVFIRSYLNTINSQQIYFVKLLLNKMKSTSFFYENKDKLCLQTAVPYVNVSKNDTKDSSQHVGEKLFFSIQFQINLLRNERNT